LIQILAVSVASLNFTDKFKRSAANPKGMGKP
jgi:hypothetical protein